MTLLDDLRGAPRVLLAHAHPDDETLSTGALALDLADHGVEVQLVTATRGERGEVVPEALPTGFQGSLEQWRERELDAACGRLGIVRRVFLGERPASAGVPHRYVDSGMRWVAEGLAGPAADVAPEAFSLAPVAEAADDLAALLEAWDPTVLVSYDLGGGYGHPDHVHLHRVAVAAATRRGVRLITVATDRPDATEWHDLPDLRDRVRHAVDAHRSQVTVDGDSLVHVGGQRQEVETWFGLAEHPLG